MSAALPPHPGPLPHAPVSDWSNPRPHAPVSDWSNPRPQAPGWSAPDPGRDGPPTGELPLIDGERAHKVDLDRAYSWERLCLRIIGYALYLTGVVGYALWRADALSFLALVVGGLLPVMFLLARETEEKRIEAQREALRPEPRGALPPFRGARAVRDPDDE
jgi:hypothetical protein